MVQRKISHLLYANFMACLSTHPVKRWRRCEIQWTHKQPQLIFTSSATSPLLSPPQPPSELARQRGRSLAADRWCNNCLKVAGFLLHSNHRMAGWNLTLNPHWCDKLMILQIKLQSKETTLSLIQNYGDWMHLSWCIYLDATLHFRLYENSWEKTPFISK